MPFPAPPAPLTISAVDHTAGTLTITGHGLNTGDGPATLFIAPGSGGVLPTGLPAIPSDAWIIKIDTNTVKLASSNPNAMAGTALTFSDNGTLPLSLMGGVPFRIGRTLVSGVSQVSKIDLDAFATTFVALWNLLTGQAQSLFPAVNLAGALTVAGNLSVGGSITAGSDAVTDIYDASNVITITSGFTEVLNGHAFYWQIPAGSSTAIARVRVPLGRKITAWSVQFRKVSNGSGTLTAYLFDIGPAANGSAISQVGSTQSTSANAPGAVTLGQPGLSAVATGSTFYQIVIEGAAATGDLIIGYSITHSH